MKLLLLFISAICLSTTGISQRAEAQNYPWCAYYGGFDDGGTNCGFTTFEQCIETARGLGSNCQPNTRLRYVEQAEPKRLSGGHTSGTWQ